MTDEEAMELLRLLHKYVQTYSPDLPQTLLALADDLAVGNGKEALELVQNIRETEGVT